MKKRCLFFDRDGIINASPGPGYVERVEDFHIIPAFVECATIARDSGYGIAVATNQRCIARGIISRETLDDIHAVLKDTLAKNGIPLLGIYCCPHERDSCTCRKPQPGLLLQAAAEHQIDLADSWMIGDSETDVEAGINAGCRTIRVCPPDVITKADFRFPDMAALATELRQILATG